MHEMAIAQSILDIVINAAEKEGAKKITQINVVAGELRGIVPLQLNFCFDFLAKDTVAEGAYVNVEVTPIQARCRQCEETFVVDNYEYICPKCGSRDVQTVGGVELLVRDIEVD